MGRDRENPTNHKRGGRSRPGRDEKGAPTGETRAKKRRGQDGTRKLPNQRILKQDGRVSCPESRKKGGEEFFFTSQWERNLSKMFTHHREREQPIFSTRAHVFQIDPATKRNWIPASKHAVTVSFFYDANRNVYRIISVGGTKAIINCSVTPSMTFTKTSQKFGQWADTRANTVYGLGFATEQQLHQFSEKFREVKDAARLAREKSQDKELANTALTIAAPQDLSDALQSPPVVNVNGPEDKLFRSQSADITLAAEKERIKKMLSEGSISLHEANANVEQWKKQLAAYQEETERLREQVADLEAHGGHGPSDLLKDELTQSLEELETLLKAKDEEIHILQSKKAEYHDIEHDRDQAIHRLREMEMRNAELERRVQNSEQSLNNTLDERDRVDSEVQRAIEILDIKIFDLNDLRQSLFKLISK
ncbi:hypothetical protein WMY93_000348 [Mugilogobius chulae]|uniref:WH1 domain-containing protein n=1 Tax=Mugilogobius chulae TaxID=88201 RepID=A0AAW0Q9R2_9GOBI